MREQFEKLPEIAKNIEKYVFCEVDNEYKELDIRYALGRIKINGAWYAYQEQQKKIELAKEKLISLYAYSGMDDVVVDIINDVEEILK